MSHTYILGKLEGSEEKGRKQGVLITAKNMKLAKIDVQTIAEVAGLSIDQIEKL